MSSEVDEEDEKFADLLHSIGTRLLKRDVSGLKLLCGSSIADGNLEDVTTGTELMQELSRHDVISKYKLEKFKSKLIKQGRKDLSKIVNEFQEEIQNRPFSAAKFTDTSKANTSINEVTKAVGNMSVSSPSKNVTGEDKSVKSSGLQYYPMRSNPNGRCVIFNNQFLKAEHSSVRRGTDLDAKSLKILFEWLKFKVEVCNSYTAEEMRKKLELESKNVGNQNHDCFVCFILSHGEEGIVYGNDWENITIKEIKDMFKGDVCPSLLGKPKLFFIQACQGIENSRSTGLQQDSKPSKSGDEQPGCPIRFINVNADILVFMATTEGAVSYRHSKYGSWFIQEICVVFQEHAGHLRLCDLMNEVKNNIAKKQGEVEVDKVIKVASMMPTDSGTLRKGFKFKPISTSFYDYEKNYIEEKEEV